MKCGENKKYSKKKKSKGETQNNSLTVTDSHNSLR